MSEEIKNKGGHPTNYSEEMLEKTKQYLSDCEKAGAMPQIAQLAYHLDVARKTLYNWADKNPEFLHIIEKLLALQEFALVGKGLSGDYNSTIAKLILVKHGYRDSQETDITSGGKPIPIIPLNVEKKSE